MKRFLIYLSFFACVIACGNRPLNRVPPKTEFIYSKDNPCDRNPNEIRDNLDSGKDQEVPQEIQPNPNELGPPTPDESAEDLRMGKWRSLYAPPVLGGYDDPGRTLDSDQVERREY